jgi:predicted TIM-barrel fold metal-dependent hydrolase
MKIVDVHTHVFPPEVIKKREEICEKDPGFSALYSKKSSVMVDIEGINTYMKSEGIYCVGVLSFPFKDKGLLSLCNDYVTSLASRSDILPFVMVDFRSEKWSERELERCFGKGARGVGEISFYSGKFGGKEFERLNGIADFLKERDGVLLLHVNEQVGHPYSGKIRVDFGSLYEFVKRKQGLKIILAHLGGGICFYEFMPEVKEVFKNVFYDTAATPFLYSKDIYPFIASYLSEKVLFGSDFPLLSFSRYKDDLYEISGKKRELVLFKNAAKLFNLS